MKEYWNKSKNWISGGWLAVKNRSRLLWLRVNPEGKQIRPAVKYLGSLLLIGLALLGTILFVRTQSNEEKENNIPEIAQLDEPSIGTPLAPDVVTRPGHIAGEVAPSPTPTTPPSAPVSGVNLDEEQFIAPKSGINPNDPIDYENLSHGFVATLPPHSNVIEKESSVTFVSMQNSRYYTVSVNEQRSETLQSIEAQLKNSPAVKNVQATSFNGTTALQFNNGSEAGVVFILDGEIYYLLGNSQYFTSFKTI